MSTRSLTRTKADVATGEFLSGARIRLGITQSGLAAKLTDMTGTPWTQSKVSSAESGRNPMTTSQVCAYARAVEIQPRRALLVTIETTGQPSNTHPGEVELWECPAPELEPATVDRSVENG